METRRPNFLRAATAMNMAAENEVKTPDERSKVIDQILSAVKKTCDVEKTFLEFKSDHIRLKFDVRLQPEGYTTRHIVEVSKDLSKMVVRRPRDLGTDTISYPSNYAISDVPPAEIAQIAASEIHRNMSSRGQLAMEKKIGLQP